MSFNFGASDHLGGMQFTAYPKEFVQPRRDPMEAMCLGLPRTGTMSVCIALNKLGIRTYDMTECARDNANGSTKRWLEGVEANYLNGQGRKIRNRRDLDDLLYRYQGVSSMPSVLFPDQLIQGYPNAKVILTETSPEQFVKSMEKSFYSIINDHASGALLSMDADYKRTFIPLLRCALRVWTRNDENNREALKEGYIRHNKHIRDTVPADRLLVFDPKKDGWDVLCDFLDKPVPKEPFPTVDEDRVAAGLHSKVFVRMKFFSMIQGWLKMMVPLLVLGYFVYRLLNTEY